MTANLLVFEVDSRHEKITDVYVGLVVCRVDSRLYSPSQIHNFLKDIEGDLQVVHDALKAGGDPGKRCTYCLFVDNLSGTMSIPTNPPYCLVFPTSYIKGIKPDHFDTRNSPVGMRLHCCVCRATCSSVTMFPNSILNMSGVTSSWPAGHNTMSGCAPLLWSHGTTAAH